MADGKYWLLLAFAAFACLFALYFTLFEVLTKAFPYEEKNDDNSNNGQAVGNNVCKEKTSHSPVRRAYRGLV